jgi:hypothetical protein
MEWPVLETDIHSQKDNKKGTSLGMSLLAKVLI